jgi:alkanesulfonate monooxygenase SsuD/methylene tetrahydromethanopterin reductase-like flavin-dependent oxidoreductase (luciferase family)
MRFAWMLRGPVAELAAEAAHAEEHGVDAVWIDQRGADDPVEPAALAAHLAPSTVGVRVGVTVEIGAEHPIELAEQIAVADLALGGRLVLTVTPAAGIAVEVFAEAVDLVLDCLASHPFRHEGAVWLAPANLPQNVFNVETRIRVTPAPAQFELPVWVAGPAARAVAVDRALGVLVDADEDTASVTAWWTGVRSGSPAWRRMRRALAWRPPAGRLDADAAVAQLRSAQRGYDADLVIVDTGGHDGAASTADLMGQVMRAVRPHVQLDRYPPGLEDHWRDETR